MNKKEKIITLGLLSTLININSTAQNNSNSELLMTNDLRPEAIDTDWSANYTKEQLRAALNIIQGTDDKLTQSEFISGTAFLDEIEGLRLGYQSILDESVAEDWIDTIEKLIQCDSPECILEELLSAVVFVT